MLWYLGRCGCGCLAFVFRFGDGETAFGLLDGGCGCCERLYGLLCFALLCFDATGPWPRK
jgi:hypothetical protein